MFQYRIISIRGMEKAEATMNKLAKDGWRVVSNAVDFKWGNVYYITFEKETK